MFHCKLNKRKDSFPPNLIKISDTRLLLTHLIAHGISFHHKLKIQLACYEWEYMYGHIVLIKQFTNTPQISLSVNIPLVLY